LKEANVPIAAPSANKFGHVSPTTANHVYNDFKDDDISIVDGGQCSFGIESTVLKISKEEAGYELLVIRKGGVSLENLTGVCKGLDLDVNIKELKRTAHKEETENCQAPGQFLRHYSPNIDSFLYKGEAIVDSNVVMLDFAGTFAHKAQDVKYYSDLSGSGDVEEAIHNVFDLLRWAETLPDVSACLITQLIECEVPSGIEVQSAEHMDGLFDRLFRATSGKLYID